MRVLAIILALLLLAGCATTGTPRVETVQVSVPIPVRCAPNLGPEPQYPDTSEALAATPDIFEGVKLLLAGRLLRIARDVEKTVALNACRDAPP